MAIIVLLVGGLGEGREDIRVSVDDLGLTLAWVIWRE
jgi:hypothetical protein